MKSVAVILTHQCSENREYLDLVLESLVRSTFQDFKLFLVNGSNSIVEHQRVDSNVWEASLNTATKKVERVLPEASQHRFILHLSDDVVLMPHTMGELEAISRKIPCIVNPMSNSDSRSIYFGDFLLGKSELIHDISISDVPQIRELFTHQDIPVNETGVIKNRAFVRPPNGVVSFYCTMIPGDLYNRIGGLDPDLEYAFDDVDVCARAGKFNIPAGFVTSAFAIHFGSKTLNRLDKDRKLRTAAHAAFMRKYGIPQNNLSMPGRPV